MTNPMTNLRSCGPKLHAVKVICIAFVFCAVTALTSPATTTFTTLVSFAETNGAAPYYGSLVQGTDGNFYGTTYSGWGGHNPAFCSQGSGCGTVFKVTRAGELTTVYSFCSVESCTDGYFPFGGLVLATNGNFYGETSQGGANGAGTLFEITSAGKLTTLYAFCPSFLCPDGLYPWGGLVQSTTGNLYGTTQEGGAFGAGTVFLIAPGGGKLTTLYNFCSQTNCTDGSGPQAGVLQATNGTFYGTTAGGGAHNFGTVFQITGAGKLTTLYSFCSQTNCTDGSYPYGGLVQDAKGNFEGTTQQGGADNFGTVFKITPTGTLTTLHSFNGADGGFPLAGGIIATDGNGYGTTTIGGANGYGTIFQITKTTFTTLYSFCSQSGCSDGENLYGNGLMQATNGNLYGTTYGGGANLDGIVYSLSLGIGAFVETLPNSGNVGAAVKILGSNLTGATGVSFNGTAAIFTVVSASEITTTVPAGATSGKVSVTTPKGTLNGNVPFRVTPQIISFSPPSGPVGTTVTITGVSLTQTTGVTFGGVSATFTVNSDTQVTATVPTGAVTGPIVVVTPGGNARSATNFTVTP